MRNVGYRFVLPAKEPKEPRDSREHSASDAGDHAGRLCPETGPGDYAEVDSTASLALCSRESRGSFGSLAGRTNR